MQHRRAAPSCGTVSCYFRPNSTRFFSASGCVLTRVLRFFECSRRHRQWMLYPAAVVDVRVDVLVWRDSSCCAGPCQCFDFFVLLLVQICRPVGLYYSISACPLVQVILNVSGALFRFWSMLPCSSMRFAAVSPVILGSLTLTIRCLYVRARPLRSLVLAVAVHRSSSEAVLSGLSLLQ